MRILQFFPQIRQVSADNYFRREWLRQRISYLSPSLLGEGGKGDEVDNVNGNRG
jgi:hypothetical protein